MHLAPLRTAATVSPEPSSVRLDLTYRHHHWPAGLLMCWSMPLSRFTLIPTFPSAGCAGASLLLAHRPAWPSRHGRTSSGQLSATIPLRPRRLRLLRPLRPCLRDAPAERSYRRPA